MENSYTKTVAAISTPPGKGGIAVIRISGEDAGEVLERVFVPAAGADASPAMYPRRAVYGKIVGLDGEILDTGIAVFFAAPASFTGENVAEISCHGGILVTSRVLEAVLAAGARPAGPGEFTRRAFMNGRMTLSEAEAVGMLLDAGTESQMKLASSGARGVLSDRLSKIADGVSELLSSLYAVIDYPDEDLDETDAVTIAERLQSAADDCDALAATFRTGRAVASGVPTLICGKPNAGKSSLYNALSGERRAIVTSVPGTTRDVLEDTVDAGGVTLRLWDSAGIRDGGDEVEMIGIGLALERMNDAELILAVYDGSAALDAEDHRIMDEISERCGGREVCTVAVVNKSDKGLALTDADMRLFAERHDRVIHISAAAGDGIDALRHMIGELFGLGEITVGNDAIVWDAARKAELDCAAKSLRDAANALALGEPEDAVCTVVESALEALRRTDGRGVSEEIVNGIFSRFCVGK